MQLIQIFLCKLVSGDFAFNFYHNIWESMLNLIIHIMAKLKDLFNEFFWFLGEYWKIVLAAALLLALIALMIFAHTPSVGLIIIGLVILTINTIKRKLKLLRIIN